MKKGIDYIGVGVIFHCHDGRGNYLFNRRGENCRDEQGCWDCGGGGLKHGETLTEGMTREIEEEYGVLPIEVEELGRDEVLREIEGQKSHWIMFRYKVLVDRDNVLNKEPEKHDEIGWFKLDELPKPLHSQIEKEIKNYRDKL